MTKTLIGDIMREPVTIGALLTVQDAVTLMSQHGVRHLVVTSPIGRPVGIMSQRDSFRHMATTAGRGNDAILKNVMADAIISVRPDTLLTEASRLMIVHRIGCLPVAEDGKLVGIVTRSDLLAHVRDDTQPMQIHIDAKA